MSEFDNIYNQVLTSYFGENNFNKQVINTAEVEKKYPRGEITNRAYNSTKMPLFLQYHHKPVCIKPCADCPPRDLRLFEKGYQPKVPAHIGCHCEYSIVDQMISGTISSYGINGPDYYLKHFGKLPDYYITKKQAEEVYGWDSSKNTVAGKCPPGTMIGGDVYRNEKQRLPVKSGRIWYECDVDYVSGTRNKKRLFYSNDGLMFYFGDHEETQFYLII